jgi:hypothetical protein
MEEFVKQILERGVKAADFDKKTSFAEPLWFLRNGFTPVPLAGLTHYVNLKKGVAVILKAITPRGVKIEAITDKTGRLLVEGKNFGTTINVPDLFKIGEYVESQKILAAYPSDTQSEDDFVFVGQYWIKTEYDDYAINPTDRNHNDLPFKIVCSNNIGHERWSKYDLRDFPDKAKKEGYEYLPIFYFSHGGQAVQTKPFNSPYSDWDSGQVGWIFVEPVTGRKEWGKKWRKMARSFMEASVQEWNAWMQGDAFYISVGHGDETLDSCGGLIGDKDYGTSEGVYSALHYLKYDVKERIEKHHLLERSDEMNAYHIMCRYESGTISKEEKDAFLTLIKARAAYDKADEAIGTILDAKFAQQIQSAMSENDLDVVEKALTNYPDCVSKTLMYKRLLMRSDELETGSTTKS